MKIQPAVRTETVRIAMGTAFFSLVMLLVFALLDRLDVTVVLGTLLGAGAASYTGRMLLLVGVAIVALTAPCFHPVAAALALLFPRLVIFLRGFVKPKNKEA